MQKKYDLIVVGAGILGLATALAGAKQGRKVAVLERHSKCVSASVRNFGFVTVSGQRAGEHWQRAKRSRDIWAEVAPQAGIQVLHQGLHLVAQRPQAEAVLEEFASTDMGAQCQFLSAQEIAQLGYLNAPRAVLYSPHELRVESKEAIAQLSAWLQASCGVDFFYHTSVQAIELPKVCSNQGDFYAEQVVLCPGHDMRSLYPDFIQQSKAQLCTLQMQRVMPDTPIKLQGALMSDLSLARYDGFAALETGKQLAMLLDKEQAEYRSYGIHLIAVQSADGSLVIGDSHVYGDAEQPFNNERIDELIQKEMQKVLQIERFKVKQRWLGVYASAPEVVFMGQPEKNLCIGMITGGTGASTSFAFAEELLASLN